MKTWFFAIAVIVSVLATPACVPAGGAGGGTLDSLSMDEDGDGFFELPTKGIDESESIAIALINTLDRAALEGVVGQDIPGLITVTLRQTITRIYEGGEEFVDTGTRNLEPFEIRIEAACPERIVAEITVDASAPLIGTVFEETFSFSASQMPGDANISFECGTVVTIEAFLAANGFPDATITVTDQ